MKSRRNMCLLGVGGYASFLAAVVLALPGLAQGQLTYTINNGTITITRGCPISPGTVTIPESIDGLPVTSIGDFAFEGCASLTDMVIGNSVTNIGIGAFYDCISLTNITIPSSVTSIGDYAFAYAGLTSIRTPEACGHQYPCRWLVRFPGLRVGRPSEPFLPRPLAVKENLSSSDS